MLDWSAKLVDESKKTKGDQYLRRLATELQIKNEIKKQKMERIRKSQEEAEAKIKMDYRRVQNSILRTIVNCKDEDLMQFKMRTKPGPVVSLARSESSQPLTCRSQSVLPEFE